VAEEAAEELPPVVVTATRTETPLSEVGSAITLIQAKEIESRAKVETADLLRDVPGLTVSGSRASGITSGVFLRGARQSQSQIFIDGVPMNSPTAGLADLSYIETLNVQSIEVLRGPQSTLWGSSAMGGVISVTTRRGEGPPQGGIFAEYGSFNTHRETIHASAGNDAADFSLAISNTMSDGINIAEGTKKRDLTGLTLPDYFTPARFLDEEDGFEVQTGSGRLGFNFLEDGRIDFALRWIEAEQDLDLYAVNPADFAAIYNFAVDDPTFKKEESTQILSFAASKILLDRWTPSLRLALLFDDIENYSFYDPFSSSRVKTQTFNAELQNDVKVTDSDTLTFGAEYQGEQGEILGLIGYDEHSISTYGLFLQNQLTLFDSLHLTAGVRYDDHSYAGDKTTYRFTGAYEFERWGTKPHASVGTGFRSPNLNELFYPFFGNPDLKPEESFGWDIGIEQHLFDGRLVADVTYFRNEFDEMIEYTRVGPNEFRTINIAEATTEGVEVALKARVHPSLTLRATYTYQDTWDKENQKALDRIPEHTFSLGATYTPIERIAIDLNILRVQNRIDDASGQVEDMDDYTRVDVTASYRIVDTLKAHLRIENLIDDDYEEIAGFQSPGIGVYGGLSWQF
jgi:vitamin B12 transporter